MNIFLDPAVITTPEDHGNREGFDEWLQAFQSWLKEALLSPYHWFHASHITSILEEQGRFPSFKVLQIWQRQYHLDINLALLTRDINMFFRNEDFDLRKSFEFLDYLIEVQKDSTIIHPQHISNRWLPALQDDMYQLLAHASVYRYLGHPFGQQLYLATLRLPNHTKEINISTVINAIVPDNTLVSENTKIFQTLPLLSVPDDLAALLDIPFLWRQGEKGIIYAIEQTFKKTWQDTVHFPLHFRLGSCFIQSVNEARLDTNEEVLSKIIRYAAAAIADQAKNLNCNLRHLRETNAAGSSQFTRASDSAKAWRLTITDKGAGWRMHYWQIPTQGGSIIEFANILKKNEPEKIC